MTELKHPTEMKAVGSHRLRLRFDDGGEGILDASNWEWSGVFQPLADPKYFAQAQIDAELRTIVWPNGADVAPETLHALAVGREPVTA